MRSFLGACAAAALIGSGVLATVSAQEKVFPSYEKLQQGPWQARGWSGRDFAFVQYPWTKSPLADPVDSRIAHECEAQKLLTPIWKDPKYVYPLEIGEWDWGAYHFLTSHSDVREWLQKANDRETACYWLQTYYRTKLDYEKNRQPGMPVLSFPGHFSLDHYGAKWGADILGHEIGEHVISTQAKIAFLRGAARQFGLPTFVDVSQHHANFGHWARGEDGNSSGVPVYLAWLDETAQPTPEDLTLLKKISLRKNVNGGHSASFMARCWYMSWLAGVNVLLPEAAQCYFFSYNTPEANEYVAPGFFIPKDRGKRGILSPAGKRAQKFLEVVTRYPERGIPYTPFGVMLDEYCGFNGSVSADEAGFRQESELTCRPRPFGVLKPTLGDREIYLFFDTVWPSSMYLDVLIGRSHDQMDENRRLVASPYGDSFDVVLSDASQTVLDSYPVIIALGDQRFTADTVSHLEKYLRNGGRLLVTPAQVRKLGSDLPRLKKAGSVEVFGLREDEIPSDLDTSRWLQPFLPKASDAEVAKQLEGLKLMDYEKKFSSEVKSLMDKLCREYMPVKVTGEVEYLVNRTRDGWVVGLINNEGVTKDVFRPVRVDASKSQSVVVELLSGKLTSAKEWCLESELIPQRNQVSVEVPPGEVRVVKLVTLE